MRFPSLHHPQPHSRNQQSPFFRHCAQKIHCRRCPATSVPPPSVRGDYRVLHRRDPHQRARDDPTASLRPQACSERRITYIQFNEHSRPHSGRLEGLSGATSQHHPALTPSAAARAPHCRFSITPECQWWSAFPAADANFSCRSARFEQRRVVVVYLDTAVKFCVSAEDAVSYPIVFHPLPCARVSNRIQQACQVSIQYASVDGPLRV